MSIKEKAEKLHRLHQKGEMLVFPNIWDPLGALLLQNSGHPAIATASAAIAFANGYEDGENTPFNELLAILKRITAAVTVPVTADIESGYADNENDLQKNINAFLDTGIVGINIEDSQAATKKMYPVEVQCNRIRIIRKTAEEKGVPLFINARTDVILHSKDFPTATAKFDEIIKRGLAYKDAGANCFFPIAVKEEKDIKELATVLDMPVNILIIPGIPDLKRLKELGVIRVSLGPSFLKYAIKAMHELSTQLQHLEGLASITSNEITTDYLKSLVNKKP